LSESKITKFLQFISAKLITFNCNTIARVCVLVTLKGTIKTKATLVHVRQYLVMLSKPFWLWYDTSTCIDRKRSIAWYHKPTSIRLVPVLDMLLVPLCIHQSQHLYESIDLLLLQHRDMIVNTSFVKRR